MSKELLKDLLECLNQNYPKPTLKENLRGIDGMNFDDILIRHAERDGFIKITNSTYQLTRAGIEMLNSVIMIKSVNRLKGLLEALNNSTQNLDQSIKSFDKSSRRAGNFMLGLTIVIAVLTAIQVGFFLLSIKG